MVLKNIKIENVNITTLLYLIYLFINLMVRLITELVLKLKLQKALNRSTIEKRNESIIKLFNKLDHIESKIKLINLLTAYDLLIKLSNNNLFESCYCYLVQSVLESKSIKLNNSYYVDNVNVSIILYKYFDLILIIYEHINTTISEVSFVDYALEFANYLVLDDMTRNSLLCNLMTRHLEVNCSKFTHDETLAYFSNAMNVCDDSIYKLTLYLVFLQTINSTFDIHFFIDSINLLPATIITTIGTECFTKILLLPYLTKYANRQGISLLNFLEFYCVTFSTDEYKSLSKYYLKQIVTIITEDTSKINTCKISLPVLVYMLQCFPKTLDTEFIIKCSTYLNEDERARLWKFWIVDLKKSFNCENILSFFTKLESKIELYKSIQCKTRHDLYKFSENAIDHGINESDILQVLESHAINKDCYSSDCLLLLKNGENKRRYIDILVSLHGDKIENLKGKIQAPLSTVCDLIWKKHLEIENEKNNNNTGQEINSHIIDPNETQECNVCLVNKQKVCLVPCGHPFCATCVCKLIHGCGIKLSCPNCNKITTSFVVPYFSNSN